MSALSRQPIRVLVVEDREDDFHYLSHVFAHTRNLAYRLDWAQTYDEGRAALQRGGYDIALFDYTLGGSTGVELLQEAHAMGCTMPIVLLTGHESPEIDEAALRAGAVDFLGKATLDHVHLERAIRYALRQAEMRASVRHSQQQLELFMQSLPVVAGRLDGQGRVTEARGRGLEHAGLRPETFLGRVFADEYPQAAEAIHLALNGHSANFLLSGRGDRDNEWHAEFFVTFDAAHGAGATFIGHDVSTRRWLERRLLTASDAEQQRIGADLHDGLGQQLTGLACLAAALRDKLKQTMPAEAKQAELIATLANDSIAQSRALARGLCPVQLENAGLVVALEEMSGQAHTLHGVDCRFECEGPAPQCDHLTAMHLYRIAQEAVHNAVRHGKARRITISLTSRGNEHRLVVVDDGSGFEAAAHAQAPGGGLRLMSYRAAMIGGVLSTDSRPGHGTRLTCHFSTFGQTHENDPIGKTSDPENCEVAC